MKPNQNRPIENLLQGLSQHAQFLTKEERKAELRERGIDVDGFLNEAHSIIDHHQKEQRLGWMKAASEKQRRITSDSPTFISWVGKRPEAILAAFQDYMKAAMSQQAVAFRNKTDLTVEDMARILDDHERLRKNASDQKPPEEAQ